MTSFRDLNCGNDVAMMDKLGRFDREFIVYGCAFLQKDEPHYFVSSRADTIDHFVQQSSLASLYPTPVSTALSACSVPAGAQSELARSAKMTLARELSHTYSPLFWRMLQKLTALPANNTGAQLIEERFAQLNGCFQPESLSLMAGLLQMTFAQNASPWQLTKTSGHALKKSSAKWKMMWSSKKPFDGHFLALPTARQNSTGNISMMAKALLSEPNSDCISAKG